MDVAARPDSGGRYRCQFEQSLGVVRIEWKFQLFIPGPDRFWLVFLQLWPCRAKAEYGTAILMGVLAGHGKRVQAGGTGAPISSGFITISIT
jgi:hypothetical protein